MYIPVTPSVSLTEIRSDDRSACINFLNEREIFLRTLNIPYPYTSDDFDQWLEMVNLSESRFGQPVQFAIRDSQGAMIGAIGFHQITPSHRAEIGYWLGMPFWGRGIMTAAVAKAVDHAIERWQLMRIVAYVFATNASSTRVLEKNQFQLEGVLRKHELKEGLPIDVMLYAWA